MNRVKVGTDGPEPNTVLCLWTIPQPSYCSRVSVILTRGVLLGDALRTRPPEQLDSPIPESEQMRADPSSVMVLG